jgi:hypothetical protein
MHHALEIALNIIRVGQVVVLVPVMAWIIYEINSA